MKKIYLTALLLFGLIAGSFAQRSYWTFNWDMNKGLGETGDFVDKFSVRGASVDGRFFINENITVGGFLGWSTLYDKLYDLPPITADLGDGVTADISGTQMRYLNTFPVLINAHYFMGDNGSIRPYAGIGIGTVYTEQRVDLGFHAFIAEKWGFAVQPEIGVFIPIGLNGPGVNLAARYLYGSTTGGMLGMDKLGMFTFAVGFGFMN